MSWFPPLPMLPALAVLVVVASVATPAGATSLTPISPAPVEQCGNCADDDGDGLVDFADDDCCTSTSALTLDRLAIRGGDLRLAVHHALPATAEDTTLQVVGDDGVGVCASVGAGSWGPTLRVVEGRGRRADGFRRAKLDDGRFHATVRGQLVPTLDEGAVAVTLRVGTACARTTTALRPHRRLLVAP